MPLPRIRLRSPAWLRPPRRTARLRLTGLCGGLFLVSGAALVAITYALFERATEYRNPHLPSIPNAPTIGPLAQAEHQVSHAQQQLATVLPHLPGTAVVGFGGALNELAKAQSNLKLYAHPGFVSVPPLAQAQTELAQAEHQLAAAVPPLAHIQGQLAAAQRQLSQAVHQIAQAGSAQAAQRAADSHELLVNSGIALAIVAVLALLAGWLVAGRMLRPIRTITRKARRISSTSLHERLALDGPQDELKELGDTLDDLFGRLESAFDAQRHFVANASHELRTPLTAERNLLQVALDDPDTSAEMWRSTAEELLASNDEQKHLIEALLTLASSETGLTGLEPVDLVPIVTMGIGGLRSEADRLGIRIDAATAPALLDGDALLVERLVANLLANAVYHNVPGGHVDVSSGTQDGKAVLTVTNTGPVVPPAEVDRLFQPFQRLDPRRSHYKDGHGLGLSIVRAIAASHGATITARPVPEGGLSVSVSFPPPANLESISSRSERDGDHAELAAAAP